MFAKFFRKIEFFLMMASLTDQLFENWNEKTKNASQGAKTIETARATNGLVTKIAYLKTDFWAENRKV